MFWQCYALHNILVSMYFKYIETFGSPLVTMTRYYRLESFKSVNTVHGGEE